MAKNDPIFGKRLDVMMKRYGLTNSKLAAAVGTTEPAISNYRSKGRYPETPIFLKMCAELFVDPFWLAFGQSMPDTTNKIYYADENAQEYKVAESDETAKNAATAARLIRNLSNDKQEFALDMLRKMGSL